ncbi:hypothetical protein GEMRC1_001843 [Eukaryota sp. GEM-RC1]
MQLSYSLEERRPQQQAPSRVTNRQPRNQPARSSRPSPSSSSHLTCKEPGHVKADCPDPVAVLFPAHQNRAPRPSAAREIAPRNPSRDQPRDQPLHRRNSRDPTINRRPNTRSANQRQVNSVDTSLPAPEFVDHIPLCLPVDLGIDDSQSNSVNAVSTHPTSAPFISKLPNKNDFLKINLTINGVRAMGTIDTTAKTSCITQDIALAANMEISEKQIPILIANQSVIYSPGLACAKKVHLKSTLPILPGHSQLLIGCDILTKLGLMNANGVYIKLDEEHRNFISAETAFDQFMTTPPEVFATNPNFSISSFKKQLELTKTRIELPATEKETLIDVLAEFAESSDVFSDLPHPDGIDCEP